MPSVNTGSPVVDVARTGEQLIDALLTGKKWAVPISYSFPEAGSSWSTLGSTGYGTAGGAREPWMGFSPLSGSDRIAFAAAVEGWSAVANVQLSPTLESSDSVGDIRAAYTWGTGEAANAQAWAYTPSATPVGGDIWFNSDSTSGSELWSAGSYAYLTAIHELGHALGLKHPFENGVVVPGEWDALTYTVMSYTSDPATGAFRMSYYPTTPMVLDIQAIQFMYGANNGYRSGADTYVYDDSTPYHQTIWDGGGADTIRYDGSLGSQIDLREGHGSFIGQPVHALTTVPVKQLQNVWVAFGASIEDATGGLGADVLTGNTLDNALGGRGGDDSISGGAGNDRLTGDAGNDVLEGGSGIDTACYAGTRSSYALQASSAGYTVVAPSEGVDTLSNVERLAFSTSSVALDLGMDQAGGEAALVLGAVLGGSLMRAKQSVIGIAISYFDQGVTVQQLAGALMRLPIWDALTGRAQASNSDIAGYLLATALGRAPDQALLDAAVVALDNEAGATQGRLLSAIALHEINQNQIDLAGLRQAGLEFI